MTRILPGWRRPCLGIALLWLLPLLPLIAVAAGAPSAGPAPPAGDANRLATLGPGDSVALQRTFGQAYQDVTPLSGADGPVTAPALDTMGQYSFRVAIESNGSVLSACAPVTVEAYASVPLAPFNAGSGTVQVGNRVFTYTDTADGGTYPQYDENQAWTASTCRSITVQFADGPNGQQDNATAYLEFVQQSSDPVYASAPVATVKSVTVPLDGGPLYINGSSSAGFGVVFTATGSCYTPTGQPQT